MVQGLIFRGRFNVGTTTGRVKPRVSKIKRCFRLSDDPASALFCVVSVLYVDDLSIIITKIQNVISHGFYEILCF